MTFITKLLGSMGLLGVLALIGLWLALFYGWVVNIIAFIGMLDGGFTAMFVARMVGIVLFPLGGILGLFA